MDYDIKILYNELIKVQKKLDSLQEKKSTEYQEIFNAITKEDGILTKYINKRKILENERRLLMKKYDKELNAPFRDEIIKQIRTEVRKKYPSVGIKELLHFSTNVFINCTLKEYNINEQEILNEIVNQNNIYFEEIEKDDEIEENTKLNCNLEYLQYLNEKYTKLIKERI